MELHISAGTSFDVLAIVRTVTASIFEVFFLCLVGYILSVRGVIDSKSKATLNKINVSFFTPSLMFSKVAFSLTYEKLAELYVVPISFVIITVVSFVIGWLLSKAFRLKRAETNFCLSFSMFMNSNSLPIALMTSLTRGLHDKGGLNWGADDSRDKQLGRSLSYLVVFSTMGLIVRWSYGVGLLSASVGRERSDSDVDREDTLKASEEEAVGLLGGIKSTNSSPALGDDIVKPAPLQSETSSAANPISASSLSPAIVLNESNETNFFSPSSSSSAHSLSPNSTNPKGKELKISQSGNEERLPANYREQVDYDDYDYPMETSKITSADEHRMGRQIFHSFPNLKAYFSHSIASSRTSMKTTSEVDVQSTVLSIGSNDDLLRCEREQAITSRSQNCRAPPEFKHKVYKLWRKIVVRPMLRISQFMTPPLYASLLSLVVVCLPRFQHWLEDVKPLRSALKSAGDVSVPLTLVVLGAYFNTSSPKETSTEEYGNDLPSTPTILSLKEQSKLRERKRTERLTILASILARQILTPLVLTPLLFLVLKALHNHQNRSDFSSGKFHEDPCFILVMVLLIGAPSAITLAQMTSSNPFPVGSHSYLAQAKQNLRFEKLVSKTLFVSYALITPPTTIALVVIGLLIEANR
ncbi:auxin efflux carrier [Phakopsora pachyrhizi]|nr:auxin efflux carrier [Phakopsora pachyrhizi]